MQLSVSLSLKRDSHEHTEKLGVLNYTLSSDGRDVLALQQDVPVIGSTPITVGSSYIGANGNLSFALWHAGHQHLVGMFRWDSVTPYLGVRLPDLGFLHINFKKTET
jgi:hypothetical protein